MTNALAGADGVKSAHDHLTGTGAVRVFRKAVLQQFGVRQDDPELVIQEVEEL